mmetsp:Transcript_1683/g.5495  ORF Transcript_1683/g.5495 Transcript_1683/m.5495 type:complete len:225 (-) Transcript_1683:508-1182(-)
MKSTPPCIGVKAGRSRSSLKTIMPPSCPAARRFDSWWTARIQKRSCSRRNVCTPCRFDMSHTRMDLSSELEMMSSCFGWKSAHDTLLMCPRSVSTSQALVSFMRHSLTCRSSAPETISGSVEWNDAQLTPRSWPSRTYLTVASLPPKRSSTFMLGIDLPSLLASEPGGANGSGGGWLRALRSSAVTVSGSVFLRRPAMSQTRTVWSSEAERTRSSFGWNCAHIT